MVLTKKVVPMSGEYEYKDLLKRARDKLPEKVSSGERFKLPELDLFYEGKTTIVRNYLDLVETLSRDPQHLMAFLLREVGTAGNIDGRRAIFKKRMTEKELDRKIANYVDIYVICSECNRPDTRLQKEGRTMLLKCDACGAHRPVKIVKAAKDPEVKPLEEGKVYELMIEDVSRRGDGVAKVDKYIIYVPGTAKGSKVKVHIEKISGKTAFGRLVRE
jgi:translation initiation factor 2 subunit 2